METSPALAMATFLMTDIEGSTRLWEEHRDAMAVVLERHDATLREVVVQHDGRVVKTTGDGMLAAFADPAEAARAAIDGQRRLASLDVMPGVPVRVRMALHTGTAQARDDDYFGPALNRVARLLAIGHGGQILVSGVTAALLIDQLGAEAELIDRGDHVLRDVARAERVHQLVAPGLTRDFPPLRSVAVASTLPIQMTSFVGREREIGEIDRLSRVHRLVTLIGVGGTGKTRLMLEVAPGVASRFRDGVRLAELAPTNDPDLVPLEVLRAIGGQEHPGSSTTNSLIDVLRYKELLLLLDNCEHVIDAATDVAYRIVTHCPGVTILATSREALGVDGETIFQVSSLGVVRVEHPADPHARPAAEQFAEIASAAAVRLFVDRATSVVPSFTLTPENAPVVAEICERLDGIPLAIELAAARVTVLSVQDILQRLGDRFRLLTGGRRSAVPRQQTLQAMVDWSWDLLAEEDRRLLRRLSVFSGGWTLDAARAVCGEPGSDVNETLDSLERLVVRSMADVDRAGGTRYGLLETIRQYALDRLAEADETEATRDRHVAYFVGQVEHEARQMKGAELIDALTRIDQDVDNVRAAIEWSLVADPESAGRLCVAMWFYWRSRGNGLQFVAWLDEAVERVRALPPTGDLGRDRGRAILLSRLLSAAAFAASTRTSGSRVQQAEEGLVLARSLGDHDAIIEALGALWTTKWFAGATDGLREIAEASLAEATLVDDPYELSMAEAALAAASALDDPVEAERRLRSAADHARRSGNAFAIAFVSMNFARILGWLGRMDDARGVFDDAYAAYVETGDERLALATRSDLGHALRAAGDLDAAAAIYRQTIHGWEDRGERGAIANQFESFAFIAIERGDLIRAATLLGAAESLRDASGAHMVVLEQRTYDASVADLRARLDPSELATAWTAGGAMSVPSAVELATVGAPIPPG